MGTQRVDEPFRSDRRFWRSVAESVAALVSVVAASVIFAVMGGAAVVAFVVPVGLVVVAAGDARASTATTRPHFASRHEWRHAERRAVAAALGGGRRRT